jgi:hypothetical protein
MVNAGQGLEYALEAGVRGLRCAPSQGVVGMTFYKFSVGVVLTVAMVGVLAASALVFSARDFQFGVAQVSPSTNGRVDFAALERVDRQISAIQSQPQSGEQIQTLQAQIVPETEHYDRIRNEARSLQSLSVFGVSTFLAEGHPALLSIMLVLLMGALGSLLYLFPAYLNRAPPVTMAEIFVRLIFGMCAALAAYVLANALASFSVGSAPTTQLTTTSAALNPFTVSLIGIVAGVMSEDIAKWIQERGRGVLGGTAARPSSAPPAETAPSGGLVNNEAIR